MMVEGRVDSAVAPQLDAEIKASIGGVEELVLDMENLEYMSSAGLRVLLATQKTMNRQGKMTVVNVNETVQEIFDITGFSEVLTIRLSGKNGGKTDVISVSNNGAGFDEALEETEFFAECRHFGDRESLRLRLLAEEMMGMVKAIVGDVSARFWIEGRDMNVQLMLEADTRVDSGQREQILAVSSSGKNYARRTFMGKLAGLFESCMTRNGETAGAVSEQADADMTPGSGYDKMWSLGSVRGDNGQSGDGSDRTQWDELEKSIVANLADEVIVGVKSNKVQMIIKKNFQPKSA